MNYIEDLSVTPQLYCLHYITQLLCMCDIIAITLTSSSQRMNSFTKLLLLAVCIGSSVAQDCTAFDAAS